MICECLRPDCSPKAAIFWQLARGVGDGPLAFETITPLMPWEPRKHAKAAPEGPAPTIKTSASSTGRVAGGCSMLPMVSDDLGSVSIW